MRSLAIGLCAASVLASPLHAETLHLICSGGGTKLSSIQGNSVVSDGNGQSVGHLSTTSQAHDAYSSEAEIDISGTDGRVRYPRNIMPPIHGGKDGWFELRELSITDREIKGRVSFNFLNRPSVRIDRMTGAITIDGMNGNFSGSCQRFDPATQERKF